ncbi:MAG: hypothetical protein V7724_03210 [Sediminicola sp.]
MVEDYNNDRFAGQRTACPQNNPNRLPFGKVRDFRLTTADRDPYQKNTYTRTFLGHSWEMLGNLYISPLKKLPLPLTFQGKPWKPAIFDNGDLSSSIGKALKVDANERQYSEGKGQTWRRPVHVWQETQDRLRIQ